MRAHADATDAEATARAEAYLRTAELHPALARPADVAEARALLRTVSVVHGLRPELRLTRAISGTPSSRASSGTPPPCTSPR